MKIYTVYTPDDDPRVVEAESSRQAAQIVAGRPVVRCDRSEHIDDAMYYDVSRRTETDDGNFWRTYCYRAI